METNDILINLSIDPLNGQYYTNLDEVKAHYMLILIIIIMISIMFICA